MNGFQEKTQPSVQCTRDAGAPAPAPTATVHPWMMRKELNRESSIRDAARVFRVQKHTRTQLAPRRSSLCSALLAKPTVHSQSFGTVPASLEYCIPPPVVPLLPGPRHATRAGRESVTCENLARRGRGVPLPCQTRPFEYTPIIERTATLHHRLLSRVRFHFSGSLVLVRSVVTVKFEPHHCEDAWPRSAASDAVGPTVTTHHKTGPWRGRARDVAPRRAATEEASVVGVSTIVGGRDGQESERPRRTYRKATSR